MADFVVNIVSIEIITKYLEHHVLANQHVKEEVDARQNEYYKMYNEALKNTPSDDNTKFQIGCEHANKFVQLNQDKMDSEAHSLTIGQQNKRTLRCTTVQKLLLLNHTDVILKQGTT